MVLGGLALFTVFALLVLVTRAGRPSATSSAPSCCRSSASVG